MFSISSCLYRMNIDPVDHEGNNVTDRVTTSVSFRKSLLRPSSGSEEGCLWRLSSHRGESEVLKVLSSCAGGWVSRCASRVGRTRGVGVVGLVLPPDGAPLSGNLDNAKDL
jgi:hypothetical protein